MKNRNYFKAITFVLLILSLTSYFGCDTNHDENNDLTAGVLRDYTGLDGCAWVIELEDNSVLEPVNLDFFDFNPADGQRINFKYREEPALASICMAGTMVSLLEIENIDVLSCNKEVIIDSSLYRTAPNDPFFIQELKIFNNCLKIKFSASGCSGDTWEVDLIDSGQLNKTNPLQRVLRLSLENKEECEAVITKTLFFNIADLQVEGEEQLSLVISEQGILYTY